MIRVELTVNGQTREHEVEPRLLLVHYLREKLSLTGTHIGCDTTQCGACTVHMNGLAVKSCTVLTVQAAGAEIRTIEDMAGADGLSPLQQAFRDHHGLQCGFCTPGMIMAAEQILRRYPDADETRIRHELDGNICRCTGYRGIVAAIMAAAKSKTQPAFSDHEG